MRIKRQLLTVLLCLVCSCLVKANVSNGRFNIQPDSTIIKQVNFIKSQFADINAHLTSYKKTIKNDDSEEGAEGPAEITKYTEGKSVKKIKVSSFGETGNLVEEYYFSEGKLIFYYSAESTYKIPLGALKDPKDVTVRNKTEKRYYFNNGSTIKYLNTPSNKLSTIELKKATAETQADVRSLLK